METTEFLFFAVLTLLYLLTLLTVPSFFIRRAVMQVIHLFREHHATGAERAKTMDELGLGPTPFMDRAFKTRDYKPYALKLLINTSVINETNDGKVYLSESALSNFCTKYRESPLGICQMEE